MIDPGEQTELRAFIRGLILNVRMNYGNAMALAGIDSDLIYEVHNTANQGVLDWLAKD